MNFVPSLRYLDALTPDLVRALVDNFARACSPMSQVLIHQIGGAVARVGELETAFPHRKSPYLVNLVGMWQRPQDDAANIDWTRRYWNAVRPSAKGTYVKSVSLSTSMGPGIRLDTAKVISAK